MSDELIGRWTPTTIPGDSFDPDVRKTHGALSFYRVGDRLAVTVSDGCSTDDGTVTLASSGAFTATFTAHSFYPSSRPVPGLDVARRALEQTTRLLFDAGDLKPRRRPGRRDRVVPARPLALTARSGSDRSRRGEPAPARSTGG